MTDKRIDTGRTTQSLHAFSMVLLVLGVMMSGFFLCASLFARGLALRRNPATASFGTATLVFALVFAATFSSYKLGKDLAVRDNAIAAAQSRN